MYTAIARRRLVNTLRHLQPTFGSPLTSHSSLQTRQAHSAIPDTSRTHESEKPIPRPTGHIQLDTAPCWTLRDDPIPDKIQARIRTNGRELLPFNNGRPIAPDGSQKITPVGHPTPAQQSSGKKTPKLFEPMLIRNRPFLKNRIVVSPMCMYSCDDGFMNDFHFVHLGRFAVGGVGMVIFEATSVAFEGRISPTDSGLWKDEQMEPLKRIVQFLRSQDCVAGIQLAHAGRKASTLPPFQVPRKPAVVGDGVQADLGGWPEAVKGPSSIAFADDFIVPNEMTTQEIKQVVQQFIDSAKRAEACGFKFIEVHAAHGYLLTSFMCASSNKRTDEYGGSFDNRLRFLREVVEGVRAAVSRDIPIGVRLTCEEWIEQGWHMEDTLKCVDQLQRLGVDIIDCSSGGNNLAQKIKVGPGYQVPFARGVKKAYPNLTTGAVGIITEPKQAEKILQDGEADFVLLARQMLRDPQWALHAAKELDYDITWAPQFHYLGLSRR